MVDRLVAAGYVPVVHARRPQAQAAAEAAGLRWAGSIAETVRVHRSRPSHQPGLDPAADGAVLERIPLTEAIQRALNAIGVERSDSCIADGHSEHYDKAGNELLVEAIR